MADTIDSVNKIIISLRGWAKGSQEPVATICRQHAETLEDIIKEIQHLRNQTVPLPTRLGDLSDIPPELRAELSGVEVDELESQLIAVINAYGGTADLNQILVGLFRKFKVVQTRRFAQQKLWRMTTDGLIWSVPKRKGVYTTTKPTGTLADAKAIVRALKDSENGRDGGDASDFVSASMKSASPLPPRKTPRAGTKPDDDEIPF
jgi:hypothetical protein